MTRQSKSQWDFGELFPAQETRKVLTVGELTAQIRRLLETQIGNIWVTGEVSNCRVQASGHIYFTLKDADSQLNCVLFRSDAPGGRAYLQDGRKVVLRGSLTVYEPRGQYQLRVTAVELQGLGALQAAFERLKEKLNAEGLFAPERKRPLPPYPRRLGVVTSSTGAAIRDVLHVVRRRNPTLEILLAPCRVQGDGAALEIAAAIRMLNKYSAENGVTGKGLDVILVTRGGGSLEDLWAFNEEVVARAIYESAVPVVSAVGHEIDFTISDFVADLRAATPSAAAEILTEDVFASTQFLGRAGERFRQLIRQRFEEREDAMDGIRARLQRSHPRRRIEDLLQLLDDLHGRKQRAVRQSIRERRLAANHQAERLARARPALVLARRRETLDRHTQRLRELVMRHMRECKESVGSVKAHLRHLGPDQVLSRGYSITMNAGTGAIIRTPGQAPRGTKLRTRLKTGEIRSTVEGAS